MTCFLIFQLLSISLGPFVSFFYVFVYCVLVLCICVFYVFLYFMYLLFVVSIKNNNNCIVLCIAIQMNVTN